jgi:hypothetical protein
MEGSKTIFQLIKLVLYMFWVDKNISLFPKVFYRNSYSILLFATSRTPAASVSTLWIREKIIILFLEKHIS